MSTDIDVDMSTEDGIDDIPEENGESSMATIPYSERELEDLKEKFLMFDDDGGGGLTAPELEKCNTVKYSQFFHTYYLFTRADKLDTII